MRMLCLLASSFGFIILALALVVGIIVFTIKIIKGGVSRGDREQQNMEAKMVQDIYQGLRQMEERVETLETLLMDQDKRGDRRWDDFNK